MTDKLAVLSAEDAIRRNVNVYFGSIGPHPALIASDIAQGALVLGCKGVAINVADGWWLVSGTSDWFKAANKSGATEENVFDATWALPELGVNCFRSEIMARVFSEATITSTDGNIRVIKGPSSLASEFEMAASRLPYTARVVGFKFLDGA